MNKMLIVDAQQKAETMRAMLLSTIQAFERETGLVVDEIRLIHTAAVDGTVRRTQAVGAVVRLE